MDLLRSGIGDRCDFDARQRWGDTSMKTLEVNQGRVIDALSRELDAALAANAELNTLVSMLQERLDRLQSTRVGQIHVG